MYKITSIFLFIFNFNLIAQCTIYDATDCQCANPNDTDCDLLPDIQVSWFGLENVTNGPTEYSQTGEGENNGRLRISVSTPNVGHGPLTVRGAGPDGYRTFICSYQDGITDTISIYDPSSEEEFYCSDGSHPEQILWQRIYHRNSDGSMSHYDRQAGSMTYHPTHGHNHTNDWGVFTLRIKDENEPDPRNWPIVSDGAKLGFCLMDYGTCSPDNTIDAYSNDDYTGHCRDDNTQYQQGEVLYNVDFPNFGLGGGNYGCSEVVQGISSGWLDLYGEWLEEQWINLDPNICNGEYWIVGIADPNNYFLEENSDNNYSAIPFNLALQNNGTSSIDIQGSIEICEGESVELTANYGNSYLWSNGETTQSISVSEQGSYSVTVENPNCDQIVESTPTNVFKVYADPPTLSSFYDPTSACLGEPFYIELNEENVTWYNENDELIFVGTPFYVPSLEEELHLFAKQIVENFSTDNVGEQYHSGNSEYSGEEYNGFMTFDANDDFILKSIDVFTDNLYSGNRTIELKNESNQIIHDTTVFINSDATLNLNWNIDEGQNYKIGTNTDSNLVNFGFANPMLKRSRSEGWGSSFNYPYVIENIISINDSEYGNGFYYFFYNWKVDWVVSSCESEESLEVIVSPDNCSVSIDELTFDGNQILNIYDLLGRKVYSSYENLESGTYIIETKTKKIKITK
ncbi:MAG: hypothetical protein CBE48_003030 [Flavobacteriales bacterium TMED288]|nr:hypothetical protein [Flavobacteriales bacterium]RPG53069.1 MAG: hypothetical protein CBE48_003030 [Flavobacteriales bacterium TMED288]|tara:strand:+ start:27136 stop:29190 length:2055 start_codon:yes stop_codon:yes gene_type:complete